MSDVQLDSTAQQDWSSLLHPDFTQNTSEAASQDSSQDPSVFNPDSIQGRLDAMPAGKIQGLVGGGEQPPTAQASPAANGTAPNASGAAAPPANGAGAQRNAEITGLCTNDQAILAAQMQQHGASTTEIQNAISGKSAPSTAFDAIFPREGMGAQVPIDPSSLKAGRLSAEDAQRVGDRNQYLGRKYDPDSAYDKFVNKFTGAMNDPANVKTSSEKAEHEALKQKVIQSQQPTANEQRLDTMEASPLGTIASGVVGALGGSQGAQDAALTIGAAFDAAGAARMARGVPATPPEPEIPAYSVSSPARVTAPLTPANSARPPSEVTPPPEVPAGGAPPTGETPPKTPADGVRQPTGETPPETPAADAPLASIRKDLPVHMTADPQLFKANKLFGTHNRTEAINALTARGYPYTETPTSTPGISELTYTKSNGSTFMKTVYNPAVHSDAKMLDLAQKAGQRGFQEYQKNPTDVDSKFQTINQDGINFRVYIGVTQNMPVSSMNGIPYISNVHPVN